MLSDPFCCECRAAEDILFAQFIDFLDEETVNEYQVPLCLSCLRRLDLYCEKHGPKLCLHDPAPDEPPDKLMLTCSCVACACEKAVATDQETVHAHTELLREHLTDGEVPYFLESPLLDPTDDLTDDQALYARLIVAAELNRHSVEEALTDIISEGVIN